MRQVLSKWIVNRGLQFLVVLAALLGFTALMRFTGHGPKMAATAQASGSSASQTRPTVISTTAGSPAYFGTEPSRVNYLPRADSYCASLVNRNQWEPRPGNYRANHTVAQPPFGWNDESAWPLWAAKREHVTGNFTGTTSEIIQWAACKWGVDEDTIRAAAVVESDWRQEDVSDVCGPAGQASYGILQIKNKDCSGAPILGGYPATQQSTALNADEYAARMRACYDGDFYDGGKWLYGGQTVDRIAAQHGWNHVFWTCIGFHYSGEWLPSSEYELKVREALAKRKWERPGF